MPVLGLVLTLGDASKGGRGRVLEPLLRERDLTIGDFAEGKLTLDLEVEGPEEGEARVRALSDLAGVAHVDVVYANFEDLLPGQGDTGDPPWI